MFLAYFYWNPSNVCFRVPYVDLPVTWYGLFFATGFWLAFQIFILYFKKTLGRARVREFAEKLVLYMIIATIIGARLGHILFYEHPMEYFRQPLSILKTWEGGLASHGAIVAILVGLIVFAHRHRKEYPEFTFWRLVDGIAIPALVAGGMIRIGNFFNQEILGVATSVPWAVIFGHPADGGPLVPRHPAQLYESLFYFLFAALLHVYRRKQPKPGKIAGLTIAGAFFFRFAIEFIKSGQSVWFDQDGGYLLMGQLLSLPMIAVGLLIFFQKEISRSRS